MSTDNARASRAARRVAPLLATAGHRSRSKSQGLPPISGPRSSVDPLFPLASGPRLPSVRAP